MSQPAVSRDASYVLTLEEISHLASETGKPAETLMNVVALIARRFKTEVCSAYLLEPDRSNLVLIMSHNDCGAYPGVPADVVAADAVRAAAFLRTAEPSLNVESYFVDFDGVYRVE